MESMGTRAHLRFTRDYLMPGISSLIRPAAMEKCHFPPESTQSCNIDQQSFNFPLSERVCTACQFSNCGRRIPYYVRLWYVFGVCCTRKLQLSLMNLTTFHCWINSFKSLTFYKETTLLFVIFGHKGISSLVPLFHSVLRDIEFEWLAGHLSWFVAYILQSFCLAICHENKYFVLCYLVSVMNAFSRFLLTLEIIQ